MDFTKRKIDWSEIQFPPVIYKYRRWENEKEKRWITHREIFMAPPNSFKDPLDCNIPTRYELMTKKQQKLFFLKLSHLKEPNINRKERRELIESNVREKKFRNKEKRKTFQEEYYDGFCKRSGILCLAKDHTNNHLWENYASNHRGFCIAYNSDVLLRFLHGGGEVVYDNTPVIHPEPIMNGGLIRWLQIYWKERKWKEEDEYRAEIFNYNGLSAQDRVIELPKEAYHSITLGRKMPEHHKNEIKEEIAGNIASIKVMEF